MDRTHLRKACLRRRPLMLGILVAIATPAFAQQAPAAAAAESETETGAASKSPTDLDRKR